MTSELSDDLKVEGEGDDATSLDQMRRQLAEEFNVQRAKMKELFLQKEELPEQIIHCVECDRGNNEQAIFSGGPKSLSSVQCLKTLKIEVEDVRKIVQEKEQLDSEVLGLREELQQLQTLCQNQKSEIQSLQLLVNETVEESSSGSEEVRRLRARNIELEHQLMQLKQQQDVSIAPATFVRTLARKLGADSDAEQTNRKNVDENELMKSVVQPLEMEISALKDKLRSTDAQLQEALKAQCSGPGERGETGDRGERGERSEMRSCDMCSNYEKQLVAEQRASREAAAAAERLELALRVAREELEGVRGVHEETVRAWRGERAATATCAADARRAADAANAALRAARAEADAAAERTLQAVTALTVNREILNKKLEALERDNAMLLGKYTKKAADIQSEIIDLPNDVEELQLSILKVHEQLLMCEVGREEALDCETELRRQLLEQAELLQRHEARMQDADIQLQRAREEIDRLQTEREQMKELADKLRHSNDLTDKLLEDKKRLQTSVSELRGRVSVLQQELDNSEKVQQDFVRLSQSLQVQLQRIREADSEVRWQHDEDVEQCPACHAPLPNSRKKVHCRHCGRIFCGACVAHSVPSGPRRAPARVCSVCSTLLQPHTAPYFSTEAPQTPH